MALEAQRLVPQRKRGLGHRTPDGFPMLGPELVRVESFPLGGADFSAKVAQQFRHSVGLLIQLARESPHFNGIRSGEPLREA
jgi:hypothetical protein